MAGVLAIGSGERRQRSRLPTRSHQRLDIQGLRMVAVLLVFANHLFGWPRGGFVGVDVFFVISGFLITGNLLREAEKRGTVSFRRFYWNRVRRIVPAATVVLLLTWLAAVALFQPFRANEVGLDAFFAFIFMSNWRFAVQGTDYFTAEANAISPIQHYWSLSIEEQFYFVWPAVIFVISLLVLRRAWSHAHRMRIAGGVMAVIVVASLAWAVHTTATNPSWAYFDTLSRVWELGVGALLATMVGSLAAIPSIWKTVLSWTGLGLIASSLVLISDLSTGFPAPWAVLPVAGAALVIAAGVGREPEGQPLLRNPVSGYIGDISYSLYLVHWPVIVILAAVMDRGAAYSTVVIALSFGLAIASYHFVENPLRRADLSTVRKGFSRVRRGRFEISPSTQRAAGAVVSLLTVAAVVAVMQNPKPPTVPPVIAANQLGADANEAPSGPGNAGPGAATTELQAQIITALKATQWPGLDPTMESVIEERPLAPGIAECGSGVPAPPEQCTWGSPTAEVRAVIVGDSIALGYTGPLRDIALASDGRLQVRTEAVTSCAFVNDLIKRGVMLPECSDRKQRAVETINATKPDMVIISNLYGGNKVMGSDRTMTPQEWTASLRKIIDRFLPSTKKVVLLSAPPSEISIAECYGASKNTPADCITHVKQQWLDFAEAEQNLASQIGGVWIDSRPWFCNAGLCPSFVGTTPTKSDLTHLSPAYGRKIVPAMRESFSSAGVF
jgi:peptidoglycan/LPS O-acetylase OafA/YrhL